MKWTITGLIGKKSYKKQKRKCCWLLYKVKKIQMRKFINTELKSNSESDLDSDLEKIETKIDNKLKSGSDSE